MTLKTKSENAGVVPVALQCFVLPLIGGNVRDPSLFSFLYIQDRNFVNDDASQVRHSLPVRISQGGACDMRQLSQMVLLRAFALFSQRPWNKCTRVNFEVKQNTTNELPKN